MDNPFVELKSKLGQELLETEEGQKQRELKRQENYNRYDHMVNKVLDMLIQAYQPNTWKRGSDCERKYCCHISWFAGPEENYSDPYDTHHAIRRRIEIKLEMDGFCEPTGFCVTKYEAIDRVIHVGLGEKELLKGVKAVFA